MPAAALQKPATSKLPVAVFIFGGGYVLGSKDSLQPELPFYDGTGLIGQSSGSMIFVAINYRLGAYGWLAGTTMERDGLPNAGLWTSAPPYSGCATTSTWSAATRPRSPPWASPPAPAPSCTTWSPRPAPSTPLFARAIVQSPAYQWMWDPRRQGRGHLPELRRPSPAAPPKASPACARPAPPPWSRPTPPSWAWWPRAPLPSAPTVDGSLIRQLPVARVQLRPLLEHQLAGAVPLRRRVGPVRQRAWSRPTPSSPLSSTRPSPPTP